MMAEASFRRGGVEGHLLNTREEAWFIVSVDYVCLYLSDDNFESLDVM